MSIFPGLENSDNPIPPIDIYTRFLADQGNTLLLIALTRSHDYDQRYVELIAAIEEAEQRGDEATMLALLDESGIAWDNAAGYDRDIAVLMDSRFN